MRFKDDKLEQQFYHFINVVLRAILLELDDYMERRYKKEIVVVHLSNFEQNNKLKTSVYLDVSLFGTYERNMLIVRLEQNWIDLVHVDLHKDNQVSVVMK